MFNCGREGGREGGGTLITGNCFHLTIEGKLSRLSLCARQTKPQQRVRRWDREKRNWGCSERHCIWWGKAKSSLWRWVVSFTPRPLYPRGKGPGTHLIGGWMDPRAGLDDVEKRKFLTLPGLELRPLGRPARSRSLYRLRFPGSSFEGEREKLYLRFWRFPGSARSSFW
jgi:hypothetical protein